MRTGCTTTEHGGSGVIDSAQPDFPAPSPRILETVLDELAEPISVIDAEYRVRYMNRAARELFVRDPDCQGLTRCHQISHRRESPCAGDEHPCPVAKVRESGCSVRVLHNHYDGQGSRRVVEIIASPLKDGDNGFYGIVESQRDVTARERANEKIKRYAVELERSNRLKDLFIDIMRHDLLGPAGVIRGAAVIGLREETDALKREDLDMIKRSSQRMIELIQNASALAKLETEGQLTLEPADIDEMIGEVIRALAPEAAEKNLLLRSTGAAGGPIPANPLLASVFSNLIGNAIKYSPENSEILVSCARDDEGCLISVVDQGSGIPDAAKDLVFTRFTRLHKGAVKGTGLGLAIVKLVVELHGGRTWVEDAPGGGSAFFVRLDTEPRAARRPGREPFPPEPATPPPARTS